jgi:ELWxxDGT repeat protein
VQYDTSTSANILATRALGEGGIAEVEMVKDINSGSGSSGPGNFVVNGSMLYFTATTSANSTELWKSDGTFRGTDLVKNIRSGTSSSSTNTELWTSDGTPGGTTVFDINNANTLSSSGASIPTPSSATCRPCRNSHATSRRVPNRSTTNICEYLRPPDGEAEGCLEYL